MIHVVHFLFAVHGSGMVLILERFPVTNALNFGNGERKKNPLRGVGLEASE